MKFKAYFSKKRKAIVASSILVIGLVPLAVAYFVWQGSNRPVAVVNGQKITQEDLERAKQIAEKTATYMGSDKSKAGENAKAELIQRKILELAAKEKNISVSREMVKSRIDEIARNYDNDPDALFDIYGKSFGYQKNEIEEAVSYVLLKEKLEEAILKYKSGRYVYARHASGNDEAESNLIEGKKLEDWAKDKITASKAALDSGKPFSEVYLAAQNDPKYTYPLLYGTEFTNVSAATEGLDSVDKDAILKTKKGGYSDIVKSGSIYAIYFVDSEGAGRYDSWDDFFSDYQKRYVRDSGWVGLKAVQKVVSAYNSVISFSNETFGTKIALAKCSLCDGCHGATVYGTAKDAVTGVVIPGVKVKIWTDSHGTPCTSYSDPAGRCGPKSGEDATDGKGYYQFGRADKLACFVNCAYVLNKDNQKVYHWYIEASKSGYQSYGPKEVHPTNGSATVVNIKMVLNKSEATLKVIKKGSGTGKVESSSVGDGISCGVDCSQDFDKAKKKVVTLKAEADPDSVFAGWSGGLCSGTGACTVTMDGDKTVFATFSLVGVPVGVGSCNLSISPTSGEHPLTVEIAATWNPPSDHNYHDHPYECGTEDSPQTCHDWQWEWDYTSTPTWYKIYWVDTDGNIGTIVEGGNPDGTTGVTAPSRVSYTFPKALPVGESYTVKADYNYYAKGTHAPSKVVQVPVCDLISGIKSREAQSSATNEIAP